MNKQQKERQVQAAGEAVPPQDLDILFPEPEIFRIKDRSYDIYPLSIKKSRLYIRMGKLNVRDEEKALDELIDIVSELINEPDKSFLEDNLTSPHVIALRKAFDTADIKGLNKVAALNKKKTESQDQSVTS